MNREIPGKYFGTEIDEKCWRRYTKERMFARGNGTFSYDDQKISFLRLLTRVPIVIQFDTIVQVKIGKWHAGQWGAGRPILKVVWKKGDQLLSSGFSISGKQEEMNELLSRLNSAIASNNS